MNKLDEIFSKHPNPQEYAKAYADHLGHLLGHLDFAAIGKMVETLLDARSADKTIFFIGNGGSAATASHFANDIGVGTRAPGKPFRALALTDNVAVMTAIANDDGYEQMFKQQLQILMKDKDVLVAISASGNSPNVIAAVEYARSRESTVIGLSGFDGGKLKDLSDISIHVATTRGEYGPVEDIHMVMDHLIGSYLFRAIRA